MNWYLLTAWLTSPFSSCLQATSIEREQQQPLWWAKSESSSSSFFILQSTVLNAWWKCCLRFTALNAWWKCCVLHEIIPFRNYFVGYVNPENMNTLITHNLFFVERGSRIMYSVPFCLQLDMVIKGRSRFYGHFLSLSYKEDMFPSEFKLPRISVNILRFCPNCLNVQELWNDW